MLTLNGPDDAAILACMRCKSCQDQGSEDSLCFWPNDANATLIKASPTLRAALEPFARMSIPQLDDSHIIIGWQGGVSITVAHVKEARRVLALVSTL